MWTCVSLYIHKNFMLLFFFFLLLVLSYSDLFYFVLLLSLGYLFVYILRDRMGMDLNRRGSGKEIEGLE